MPALIATYSSAAGGSERLLLDVATGLADPPIVACPPGWLADHARAAGLVVFELPARSPHMRRSARDRVGALARLASHSRELRRLCEDLRPDLLVAWGMRTGIAAAASLRRMGDPPPWIFEHVDFLPGAAVARAVRAAAARADRVVCVSQAVADDLDPAGAMRDRIEVIHCGVDLGRFRPDTGGRDAAAAASEALVLGAIVPWKRPDLALEIAALAARELPEVRLRIAGASLDASGEQLVVRLRERASRPDLVGRVEFAGPLADPIAALRQADCLLHCSDREPFGLVLVEALACGTPVVAPAAGGPAEIVDQTCGALYAPGDAAAGAAALVRVLRDRDRLAGPARSRAETAFALDAMQARYRDLFDLAHRNPPHTDAPTFTFVTVTYNSGPELARLAASIARYLPGAPLVVVDNASGDDSRIVAEAAGAKLIAFDENRGFGVAANAGVAAVETPVTILVNPDVELVDDSVARLAAQVEPGRLHAPLLLNDDGSRQDSAHPPPASGATALHSLVPGPALPRRLRQATEPWQSASARRVGWATAACLVARTETLRRLGPFDESIFLYAEDLELGLRAETWFHPEARVIHSRAHTTAKEFGGENYELLAKQRREVVRRRLGPGRAIVDDLIELLTFADRALLRTLLGRSAERETARFRARLNAVVKR
jgi:glycosyltransferase involved in cell wall biosynthesis/GT2 family glycosyltransferase